jgi:hypothetical protein
MLIPIYYVMSRDSFGKGRDGIACITGLRREVDELLSALKKNNSEENWYIKIKIEDIYKYVNHNCYNILPEEVEYLCTLVDKGLDKERIRDMVKKSC